MSSTFMVLYASLMLALSIGMTVWRLAGIRGKVAGQVDGMLGTCLLASGAFYVAVILPGSQLP